MTAAAAPDTSDEIVAWVDDGPLRLDAVARRLQLIRNEVDAAAMPAPDSPEDRRLRRWVVQTLVDERLLELEATALGIGVQRRPGEPLDDAIVVEVFDTLVGEVAVSDEEVRAHYERNQLSYRRPERRRLDVIVTASSAVAWELAPRARDVGLRTAASHVGVAAERKETALGSLGAPLEQRVWAAPAGALLEPIRTDAGWYVIEVLAVLPAEVEPFEHVREAIHTDLLAAARGERFDRWLLRSRRDRARVSPAYGHPGDPRLPDSIHRH